MSEEPMTEPVGGSAQLTDDREGRILIIIQSLCQELILKIKPTRVGWAGFLPADEFYYDFEKRWHAYFMLPMIMKNKLEPGEWRPLLASFLVYERKLFRRLLWRILAILVVTVSVLFLAAPIFIVVLGDDLGLVVWLAFVAAYTVPMTILSARQRKWLKLLADRKTVELVGKDSLLEALRKIEQNVHENRKKGLKRLFSKKPTVLERIAQLTSLKD